MSQTSTSNKLEKKESINPSEILPIDKTVGKTRPPFPSNWVLKVIMAATGSVFVFFILFHLYGNIKIFIEGREGYNEYAAWLRHFLNPLIPGQGFLWIFRLTLLGCLVLHIISGVLIYLRARKARGKFARQFIAKRVTARTMIWTGIVIFLFVIFHILDLTIGKTPFATANFEHGDAYDNLVYSMSRVPVAFFYCLVMAIIAFHISHGIWSILNDFGGTGSRLRKVIWIAAGAIALVVVIGNACIPLAVQFGILHH